MKKVGDHTFLVAGAGETGTGIGEMIAEYIAQDETIPINEARKRIWMVDSKGLITRSRAEKEKTWRFTSYLGRTTGWTSARRCRRRSRRCDRPHSSAFAGISTRSPPARSRATPT
jgi:malic enzyme